MILSHAISHKMKAPASGCLTRLGSMVTWFDLGDSGEFSWTQSGLNSLRELLLVDGQTWWSLSLTQSVLLKISRMGELRRVWAILVDFQLISLVQKNLSTIQLNYLHKRVSELNPNCGSLFAKPKLHDPLVSKRSFRTKIKYS